jgi:hypothetical protein
MNVRQQINKQIFELLIKYNEENPDMRFGQLLVNCGVTIDFLLKDGMLENIVKYYEEPSKTLFRIQYQLEKYEKQRSST